MTNMQTPKSGLRILVVDDVDVSLLVLSAMLIEMGHQVVPASSGEEALYLFRKKPPDMVLMDVVMHGMDGRETVREMRRIAMDWLPILFVTAVGLVEDLVLCIEAGGDDYLHKPVNYKILRAKIDVLLHRLLLSRQLEKQNHLLLAYQERNEEEHQTAHEFMNRLLALDKIDDPLVHFHLQPAEVFSGDLIAAARTPAGNLYAMLADSTGHGLTAALAVVPVLQTFHAMVGKGYSIGTIAAEINRKVKEYLPSTRFVAAVLVAMDTENNRVSVWNGGCPPAVLLEQDGAVACRFDSAHLPLGILGSEEFDDEVEHYHYGDRRCQLLMCSDGAVDSADEGSMETGMSLLLQAALNTDEAGRLPGMIKMLERKLAGKPAHDDIALILLNCQVEAREPDVPFPAQPEAMPVEGLLAAQEQLDFAADAEWQLVLTLSATQLRQADTVPLLLHVVNHLEHEVGQGQVGRIFLVLSELFNNALDHGLLGLDSALKDGPMGMDSYFEERAARLSRMEQGEIQIRLKKSSAAHGSCLQIIIADSGKGFDFTALHAAAPDVAGMRRHGRGIALVESQSCRLHYADNGKTAHVCIPLHGPEQCHCSREQELARGGSRQCAIPLRVPVAVE